MLQGALELAAETEAAGEDGGKLPSDHLRALDYGGVAAAAHGALMAREEDCELYVRLLCDFEPAAVLPFLQSHTSYRCTFGCPNLKAPIDGHLHLLVRTRDGGRAASNLHKLLVSLQLCKLLSATFILGFLSMRRWKAPTRTHCCVLGRWECKTFSLCSHLDGLAVAMVHSFSPVVFACLALKRIRVLIS